MEGADNEKLVEINQANAKLLDKREQEIANAFRSKTVWQLAEKELATYEKSNTVEEKKRLGLDLTHFMLRVVAWRRPKWDKWCHIPTVELWEAVALSLDIDPAKVGKEGAFYATRKWMYFEEGNFEDRLLITERNLDIAFPAVSTDEISSDISTIKLVDYAAWMLRIKLEIPRRLAGIVGNHIPAPSSTIHDSDNSPTYKEATLLAIIGGLLREYSLSKPPQKLTQAEVIRDLIEEYGAIPGIGKSTLESVFARANRLIKNGE